MCFFSGSIFCNRYQYVFREIHSTIHPIMDLLNQCTLANNYTPEQVLPIFCDPPKASHVINNNNNVYLIKRPY